MIFCICIWFGQLKYKSASCERQLRKFGIFIYSIHPPIVVSSLSHGYLHDIQYPPSSLTHHFRVPEYPRSTEGGVGVGGFAPSKQGGKSARESGNLATQLNSTKWSKERSGACQEMALSGTKGKAEGAGG